MKWKIYKDKSLKVHTTMTCMCHLFSNESFTLRLRNASLKSFQQDRVVGKERQQKGWNIKRDDEEGEIWKLIFFIYQFNNFFLNDKRLQFSCEKGICGYCLLAKLCLTLCNLMDCSLPSFSIHGFSQMRILEWVVISFSIRI